MPLFCNNIDNPCQCIGAVYNRHRAFDDFDAFNGINIDLSQAFACAATVDHRDAVEEDFDTLARHSHELNIAGAQRKVV
ncbi:hypothetical protein D3C87_1921830 [compost metagenome]